MNNPAVRIPMPEKLAQVERGLRMMKQEKLADDFVATMNRAAETAVPEAANIFADAIKSMTVEDAKSLVNGPEDAATQFFRKTGEARLQEKMMPVIKQKTAEAGVTSAYKKLTDKAAVTSPFLKSRPESFDLDQYITTKAMDGLFKMIADQEKQIRQNPAARTTDLLQKVFGAAK